MLDQRESGRHQVFEAIRNAGQIARIDIAQRTSISPATVTAITSELLSAGLIDELHPDPIPGGAKRGRPRVALGVRGTAFLIAGMKIADAKATIVLLDFVGETVGEFSHPLPNGRMEPGELAVLVRDVLQSACETIGRGVDEVAGLGLGMAGLIDAERNFVYWSPSLKPRNVELGAVLAKTLPMPVFVDNDANLVAKAEQHFGEGQGETDFIVITIEQGVGMGIVLDNKIYRGERGCGAELAHTKVQLEGALCRCGQRGCLEAYVGDYALLREAAVYGQDIPHDSVATLYAHAKSGDPTAQRIFERAGRMLAMGLVNIINIFDPKLLILSGQQASLDVFDAERLRNWVKSSVVQVDAPLPEIRLHNWGDLMWAKGAAAYAIEAVTRQKIQALSRDAA
ncbi:ROK family transcriptional regulator [Gymnodinialimonas ulvae]|uniref:ROK family transcriptional regulator n=1 Tax=Gymnodinialimonas ulvae TaxID=3126504 RepID=UPI00309AA276